MRYSRNRQTYFEADSGSVGEIAPGVPFTTSQDSKDHSATFLVVPQYKITPDMRLTRRFDGGDGLVNGETMLADVGKCLKA